MQAKIVLKQQSALKLRFVAGATGPSGTIEIGTVTTGAPGSEATVTNVGSSTAAVFDFSIPQGDQGSPGDPGAPGDAATIAVGTVTTVPDGTPASVTNVGTSQAAVFDFDIPAGPAGSVTDGDKGDIVVSSGGTAWTIDSGAVGTTKLADSAIATAKIADGAATNAKLADMATSRFKGRVTAGTGAPEDITGTQATALLDTFTSAAKGLAPASGGGTDKFLRADSTWAAPLSGAIIAPQERLTLTPGSPQMTTSVVAATALYLTPYGGYQIPLYDGTSWSMKAFTELSASTTDTTKSPAAIGASKCNDWFYWDDGGTLRLSHGPDWTNDSTRSAGTALVWVNGLPMNALSITNGPAAQRGVYVGTTRSGSDSKLIFQFGAVSSGGTPAIFGLWNAFNRLPVKTFVGDSTSTWTYGVDATWRGANNANVLVGAVSGLQVDPVAVEYMAIGVAASGGNGQAGVGLNSTTAKVGSTGYVSITAGSVQMAAKYSGLPAAGYNIFYAIERNATTNATTWVGSAGTSYIQSGLHADLWA